VLRETAVLLNLKCTWVSALQTHSAYLYEPALSSYQLAQGDKAMHHVCAAAVDVLPARCSRMVLGAQAKSLCNMDARTRLSSNGASQAAAMHASPSASTMLRDTVMSSASGLARHCLAITAPYGQRVDLEKR
jgi:hypothetical protein